MAMNVGNGSGDDVMVEMNTTPLIDVMLVLLVMLIITIPIQLHAVNMDLPIGTPPANLIKPEMIQIDIDERNVVHWQGVPVEFAQLESNMAGLARQTVQSEVHIRPNKKTSYAVFAKVLATSKRQGLSKMAVIGSEQFANVGVGL